MQHHTEAEHIIAYGAKFYPMSDLGAFFAVTDGVLFSMPMMANGTPDIEGLGEVTAPQSQELLDTLNAFFDTDFKMENFAGR